MRLSEKADHHALSPSIEWSSSMSKTTNASLHKRPPDRLGRILALIIGLWIVLAVILHVVIKGHIRQLLEGCSTTSS
jgi:hypothetical protein